MSNYQVQRCQGCGASLIEGSRNCEYCGSRIQWPKEEKKETIVVKREPVIVKQVVTPQHSSTSGAAIASLVLSLFGIAPIAFICGVVALSAISKPGSNATGRGMAIAGIVISSIQIFSWIIIGMVTCIGAVAGSGY